VVRTSLGIGIVGWGGIARVHTLALRSLPVLFPSLPFDIHLEAVATRDPQGKGEEARRAGFARVLVDPRDLAADEGVDVVDICTPNALHPAAAVPAWERGKALYIEKPLADGLKPARGMYEAWRASAGAGGEGGREGGRPDQVALVLRFLPAVARARDLLEAGALGPVLTFRARMVHGGYLNPQRPMSWRLDRALSGGGALADLGVHMIDLVQFLLGDIAEVQARTRTFVAERPAAPGSDRLMPVEVDDWAEVRCSLASGAVGTIEASRVGDGLEETTLEIFGRDGSLLISGDKPEFPRWFDRRGAELHPATTSADGPFTHAALSVWPPAKLSLGWFVNAHAASLTWFLQNVQAARTSGQGPGRPVQAQGLTPDLPAALRAQAVLEAAYESAPGGAPVAVEQVL